MQSLVEGTTLDLINASEDGGERLQPLPIPSLPSHSAHVAALHVTPPLNPAPYTTCREPSVDMEATAPELASDMPDREEMPEEMLQRKTAKIWGRTRVLLGGCSRGGSGTLSCFGGVG